MDMTLDSDECEAFVALTIFSSVQTVSRIHTTWEHQEINYWVMCGADSCAGQLLY